MTIDKFLIEAYHMGRGWAAEQLNKDNTASWQGMRQYYQRKYAYECFLKRFGEEGLNNYFDGSKSSLRNYIEELIKQE